MQNDIHLKDAACLKENLRKRGAYINQFMAPSSRNLLPLAAGLLHSYARSIPKIANYFDFNIEVRRDSPQDIVARYKDPAVIAFSVYFWNLNQSINVARLAKEKFPDAYIIFGGPIVPLYDGEIRQFLKKHPSVDIIVTGEGEIVFSEILLAIIEGKDLSTVDGIIYHDRLTKEVVVRKRREYIKDVSQLPSPYLDGTYDRLYDQHNKMYTGAIFETNRGCPYSCTFCYWGGPDSRIVQFPLERIFDELNWISAHKIEYISGADANFGILKRDLEIARHIAKLKKETGYPKYFAINWAKNSSEKIFDIAKVLSEADVKFTITLSLQSNNPETLKAIKRINIKYDKLQQLLLESERRNYYIYSELILGLPLESYQTFTEGIGKILVFNLNYFFNLYYCYVIPSTEMDQKEYKEKYKIETRRCFVNFERNIEKKDAIAEYEDIVVSTSTMSIEDWKKSFTFGYFIKALYGYRAAYFIFNYLRNELGMDLIDLTEFIIQECTKNLFYPTMSRALDELEGLENSILNGQRETIKLEGIDSSLHPEVAVFIIFLLEKKQFYCELHHCIQKYCDQKGLNINHEIYSEFFAFQYAVIPTWRPDNNYNLKFNYNIADYFNLKESIKLSAHKVVFNDEDKFKSIDEFLGKKFYGGLMFFISKFKKFNAEESSYEFLDAQDFFNSVVTVEHDKRKENLSVISK